MKLWIRVDASAPRDPKMGLLADELQIPVAYAFGMVESVWCAMAEHALDGSLAGVSATTLEKWAGWEGKRGLFSKSFRSTFVNEAEDVPGWTDRQGKLIERAERDKKRKKPVGSAVEIPEPIQGNSEEIPGDFQGDSTPTVRNGTEHLTTHTQRVRDLLSEEDKPHFDRLLAVVSDPETWASEMGAMLDGMVGHHHATPPQIGRVLRDISANGTAKNATMKMFRVYVESAIAEDKKPQTKTQNNAAAKLWQGAKATDLLSAKDRGTWDTRAQEMVKGGYVSSIDVLKALWKKFDLNFLRNTRADIFAVQHIAEIMQADKPRAVA